MYKFKELHFLHIEQLIIVKQQMKKLHVFDEVLH